MNEIIGTWSHNCKILGITTLSLDHVCSACGLDIVTETKNNPLQDFNHATYKPSNKFSRLQQEYVRNKCRLINWKNKLNQLKGNEA